MSPLLCVLLSLQTLKNSLEVEEGRGEGRERERENRWKKVYVYGDHFL
jgi:hypothetical protein